MRVFVKSKEIELRMIRLNMNVVDVAKAIGMSNCYVSPTLSGKRHTSANLRKKLMEALHIQSEQFDDYFEIRQGQIKTGGDYGAPEGVRD